MFWFLLSWAHSSNCLPIKGEVYTFWDGTLVTPRGTLCCHQTLKSLEPQKANRKQREISQPERPDRYFSYHYVAKKHYNMIFRIFIILLEENRIGSANFFGIFMVYSLSSTFEGIQNRCLHWFPTFSPSLPTNLHLNKPNPENPRASSRCPRHG